MSASSELPDEQVDESGADAPGDVWSATSLEDSILHATYLERLADGRDLRAIISGNNSGTGIGKTTLARAINGLWDIWGWTADKNYLDPRAFSVEYDQLLQGSAANLDEAEQAADRRRSMASDVIAVGHAFATKRYKQIFATLTLPSKDMIDARIADKLCDFWILVEERGDAKVYFFDENPFTGKVYYKLVERIEWEPMDSDREFRRMERQKEAWNDAKTDSQYVLREELENLKNNYWRKATAKRTYELINAVYDASEDDDSPVYVTQAELGRAAGMSQSNVSKIVNADGFEDFYRSFADD